MPRLVSVAVPVPFLPPLTYGVPAGMPPPPAGARVRVPLGRRTVIGCVVPEPDGRGETPSGAPPDGDVRDLVEILDEAPYLPLDVVRLALWVADYYVCGAGEAIATALPPLASRSTDGRRGAAGFRTQRVVRITPAGLAALAAPPGDSPARPGRPPGAAPPIHPRLGPRQRDGLDRLAVTGTEGLPASALAAAGVDNTVVARLRQRGLVTVDLRRVDRDPFAPGAGALPRELAYPSRSAAVRRLTAGQRAALDTLGPLAARNAFDVALLRGVTGSGKTEVYLRLARDVVTAGRRALALVPEIALTPAVAAAFRDAFGERVAIQHSGLSDGERHDQWHRIRNGAVDVVVGTRSAVFAPLDRLGLVVVDEEHDASYKQDGNPRYHARSVAIVRAQAACALVVLGSATPSLESAHHAARRKYHLVTMDERVHRRPLADVRVVDMRGEVADSGPDTVLSRPLREALGGTLDRGEQALVLLNRRGFAAAMLCRSCGRTFECPNCSVSLTLHRAADRVRCHYCNYSVRRPDTCAHCAGPYLEAVGFGTERIEAEVAEQFPSARVARLDRDAARRRGALASLLADFRDGAIQVLVGTQMIAKGHDFPNVTLVGVISADVGLGLADFRAAERTFQLLTQVAGRAGRGDRRGVAIVQSFHPEHYAVVHACGQAYQPFFEEEMRYRDHLRYPPVVSMVNAVVRGRSLGAAMEDAGALATLIRRSVGSRVRVLGPAVAPLARLRGQHRAQVFLKGNARPAMRQAVRAALDARPDLRRRVTVDVDPVNLL
ncbi:MAG: primosomal protein N' [Acidobacteria bacterium]|nr:primosomal protein N' [Acidobacteriota bacterium]